MRICIARLPKPCLRKRGRMPNHPTQQTVSAMPGACKVLIPPRRRLQPSIETLSNSPVALNAGRFHTNGALREGIDRRSRSPSSPGETSGSLWFRLIPLFARQQTYFGSFQVKAFAFQQRHELLAILQFQAEKGDMIGIAAAFWIRKELNPSSKACPWAE
jgi:hypothetical protein